MEEKNNIDDWLKLPRELEEVSAPEGFKGRVMDRLEGLEPAGGKTSIIDFTQWSRVWQVAAAVAIMIANGAVLYSYNQEQQQERAEEFAQSLGISQESPYDQFENLFE